tara:strand:+ start:1044 stop:1286 length:243 start_codon:yes stop_codon:yes gene_type:complete
MKFFLVITFLFVTPVPPDSTNAIKVMSLNGKPLFFNEMQECFEHATNNYGALHDLIDFVYPGSKGIITQVSCIPVKEINT